MWTTVTEEEGPGLCSPNMSGECMALTRTHTQYPPTPPSTFIEPLHKSWQGPSVPSDLVVQTLVWPHRRFQQASALLIVSVLLPRLKGRSTVFYLNP